MRTLVCLTMTLFLLSPVSAQPSEPTAASPEPQVPARPSKDSVEQALEYAKAGEFERAFPIFKKHAEEGNVEAQYHLGIMYYHGEGMPRDHKKAFAWRLRAAKSGHAGAQADLGVMYFNGEGTKKKLPAGTGHPLNKATLSDSETLP